MKVLSFWGIVSLLAILPTPSSGDVQLLSGDQARQAIVDETLDPFFAELSAIDVEARLGAPLAGRSIEQGKEALRERFRQAVIDWPGDAANLVHQSCAEMQGVIQGRCPGFSPDHWRFVLTDGSEEGAAAYTRGNTIILPIQKIRSLARGGTLAGMNRLVAHETCHVYGRLHPTTRSLLLGRLGFQVVGKVGMGSQLEDRKLTNPDAPLVDSVIRIEVAENVEVPAALILYADPPRFSPTLGGGVFRYLKYGLVAVAEIRDGEFEVATDGDRFPIVYSPDSVRGFFEKVGRNTRYIISPDEILADNVALALAGSDTPLSDPRLPADLLDIIQQSKEQALTRGRPATDDRLSRVTLP